MRLITGDTPTRSVRLGQDRSHRRRTRKGELTRLERRLLSIHQTELLAGCPALPFRQRSGDVQGDFHFLFQISAICSAVNSDAKHLFSRACSSSRTARSRHRCSPGVTTNRYCSFSRRRVRSSRRGQQQLWLGEAFRLGGVRGSVAAFSTSLAPDPGWRFLRSEPTPSGAVRHWLLPGPPIIDFHSKKIVDECHTPPTLEG